MPNSSSSFKVMGGSNESRSLEELATELVATLTEKKLKFASAESCTGGMLSSAITSVSGASKVYEFGFITYANEAKVQMLGVSEDTLKEFGAVSDQTAAEMSEGALKKSNADISISITGIAGPNGVTHDKPVGLVFLGISRKNNSQIDTQTYKQVFTGPRNDIRKQSCNYALNKLLEKVRTNSY